MALLGLRFIHIFSLVVLTAHFSNTELTLHSVDEGPCISPPPGVIPSMKAFFGLVKLLTSYHRYYVPMAALHHNVYYAEHLLKRSPRDLEELDTMQTRISGFVIYWLNEGFPKSPKKLTFLQNSFVPLNRPFSLMRVTCVTGAAKSILNRKNHLSYARDTVLWSDFETGILFYRCADGRQDWKLVSLNSTVEEPVKSFVLREVAKYGFNISNTHYMKYD